jgi:preprotein translocase subunit SecA
LNYLAAALHQEFSLIVMLDGLGEGVAELGGMRLICCQHNASRRIDRQLLGRCAHQGQPGSAETWVSMDKPLIANFFQKWIVRLAGAEGLLHPPWLVALILRLPQWLEEVQQRAQCQEMMQRVDRLERESLTLDP